MEEPSSLRADVRQSRVLSLSYRPDDSVRIPAISGSMKSSSKLVGSTRRSRPMTPEGLIDLSGQSRSHRPTTSVQDRSKPSSIIKSVDRSCDRQITGEDQTGDCIIRPLERAAVEPCYWHTASILDGRSKSFVLPDRCPARRSQHPATGVEQSAPSPLPAGNGSIQQQQQQQHHHRHHHGHHHHHHEHPHQHRHHPQQHHHHHHHHHHQDQPEPQQQQQRPPLSSSSTSSSFSSTDHIMLLPSPTTPSIITAQTAQPAASRVRGCHIVDK